MKSRMPDINVIFLFISGCILTFLFIGKQSLWLDETLTLQIASQWDSMWSVLLNKEPYMWLYYVLVFLWTRFGSTEIYVRSLSAVFAIASIPILYRITESLYGKRVAVFAGIMILLHPMYIHYAQEVRSYSLLLLLVSIATLYFIKSVKSPTIKHLSLYILACSASIYTHHVALFYVLAHIGTALTIKISHKHRIALFLSYAVLCVSILPYTYFRVAPENITWIPQLSVPVLFQFATTVMGGNYVLLALYVLALIHSGYVIWSGYMKSQKKYDASRWLMMNMLWIPVVGMCILSVVVSPILYPRFLLPSIIPIVILSSVGILGISNRKVALFYLGVLLLTSAIRLSQYYRGDSILPGSYFTGKENWRGATKHIGAQAKNDEAIVFYAYYSEIPYTYYTDRLAASGYTFPKKYQLSSSPYRFGGVLPEPSTGIINQLGNSKTPAWLVVSHSQDQGLRRDAQLRLVMDEFAKLYSIEQITHFTGVDVYKFRPNTTYPL